MLKLRTIIPRTARAFSVKASLEGYGNHVFRGAVTERYLLEAGLPKNTLDSHHWTTNGNADKVATAVMNWAKDNGASVYCHWFQPLGASGVRHGMTGQVQNSFFEFDKAGESLYTILILRYHECNIKSLN